MYKNINWLTDDYDEDDNNYGLNEVISFLLLLLLFWADWENNCCLLALGGVVLMYLCVWRSLV